ncbi:MAG: hypothetical protein OCU18_07915 [Candidatus Syntrophoarchaeum sp.]|nr:hypothetical protein [Candidatus Syntrophoarchaeum sp.]
MFKLGEYDEDVAREIAGYLKGAGMKVELKPSIRASVDELLHMEGKLSDLKLEDIEDLERYERYLDALRKVTSEKISDEEAFRERFSSEVSPSLGDKKDELIKLGRDWAAIPDDEKERLGEIVEDEWEAFSELMNASSFAVLTLILNGLEDYKPGQEIGDRLDDPVLRIPIRPELYDPDNEHCWVVTSVEVERCFDLYVDEFTAPLVADVDDEFMDEYYDEYEKLSSFAMLIDHLLDPPSSSNKLSLDEFKRECIFEVEIGKRHLLDLNASLVAEDIAKVLKKNNVVKLKGDLITWRK